MIEIAKPESRLLLGYGLLDTQIGDWVASNDVATFTNVCHPRQDHKFYVRELLQILGKRFANAEAEAMWQEIENFREALAVTFGPAGTAKLIDFAQAARSWYAANGPQFEKNWYLQASFDLNYAHIGREQVKGRWLRWLHPGFSYFVEAGFPPWRIIRAVHSSQFEGWLKTLDLLRRDDNQTTTVFWVRLAAYIMHFSLSAGQVSQAIVEISRHAEQLNERYKRTVGITEAALDYFRRLELGQLGPAVIAELK